MNTPPDPRIRELVIELTDGDRSRQMQLIELARLCHAHVDGAMRKARLDILNELADIAIYAAEDGDPHFR